MRRRIGWVVAAAVLGTAGAGASEPSAERGAAVVRSAMNPPFWSLRAVEGAWRQWGVATKPDDYAGAFRERYGLHPAPYENAGLPMGLHRTRGLLGVGVGVGHDCLLCHAGGVAGKTIVGLGNASLDMQALDEELYAADGLSPTTPLPVSTVRGTTEASNFAIYLMQFRDPDLRPRLPVAFPIRTPICEDAPAWWLFKKKKTLYHLGVADSRSVRTMMPFLLIPTVGAGAIKAREADFADVRAYLLSLEPPKYPFPVDAGRAARGRGVFEAHCARCHGTYGPGGSYPNKVVPLGEIGTDPTLAGAFAPEGVAHYLSSWFARERGPVGEPYHGLNGGGYQAPPLDGVWATAPYLHNGSVPTVAGVLDPDSRPRIFTRSFRTGVDDYDPENLGLKVEVLDRAPGPGVSAFERRKVYDTTRPGRGNAGHDYGADLSPDDRRALVEYLKTL